MATIHPAVRELLGTGPLVHVTTIRPDGRAHVSLAWAGFDGDELVMATFHADQPKFHYLQRDPRISVSFHAKEFTGEGLWPYAVVEGSARITEGGALAVMDRLAEAYLGPGHLYPWRDAPPGAVVHVTVDRVYGMGPWRENR